MRTRSSRSRAIFSAPAPGSPFTFTGASMTFSSAVMWGKRLKDWNTIPTSARSRDRLSLGPVMDWPWTTISPFWIASSRFTHRMSVLFPEPDGPQTTTASPASTIRSTSWRTCRGPNHLLTPLNSMAAATPLLDHHEDVARVHRLPHLHPDLAHRPPPRGVELVLHLHGLDDDQTIPGLDLLPDLHLDGRDPPGHRGLEHLSAVDGGAAAGANDVARLLLHPDAVRLAVHLDHEDAVLLAHVGYQR